MTRLFQFSLTALLLLVLVPLLIPVLATCFLVGLLDLCRSNFIPRY